MLYNCSKQGWVLDVTMVSIWEQVLLTSIVYTGIKFLIVLIHIILHVHVYDYCLRVLNLANVSDFCKNAKLTTR